ncbi:MAG TPA: alpha/beta hydrolase [Patescibacteria group bacterium]|nr:alpha/beta hydrolase [Patescibacteria group bacterium]
MKPDLRKRNNIAILPNAATNKTIIFAHGFGSDQTAWRHVMEGFRKDYNIVLFDMVGAGRSDFSAYSPNRYSSLHAYADDLLEIIHELKLHKSIIITHSVSGMISLLASLREPGIFEKIIFVGASPRYLNDGEYKGGFEQSDLDGLFAAMSANYHAWAAGFAPIAMGNPERPELGEEFARTLGEIRPDVAQAVARVIFTSDHRTSISKLTTPSLIIQTSNDIAVPVDVGQYMHRNIPKSTLVQITAHGHLPHISAPDEIIDAVKTFLKN